MDSDDQRYRVDDLVSGGECRAALETLYTYLDGELTLERRETIRHHLEECSPCLQAFDWEAELKALVGRCCRDPLPDTLRRRIVEVISLEEGHLEG
jgi:mycothiol system anti-sigma-R factor